MTPDQMRYEHDIARIVRRGLVANTAATTLLICNREKLQDGGVAWTDGGLYVWWLMIRARAVLLLSNKSNRREACRQAKPDIDEALRYVDQYGTPGLKIQLLCDQLFCMIPLRMTGQIWNEFCKIVELHRSYTNLSPEDDEMAIAALKALQPYMNHTC